MRDDHDGAGRPVRPPRAGRGAGARTQPRRAGVLELACRSEPELFFAEKPDDVRRAKELCGRCPLQSARLAGALQRGEPWGVWGGELFLRGVVVAGKRARGRPRKAGVAA